MFGLGIGAVALAWGVLVAFLDQPAAPTGRHVDRLCTGLLIAGAAVTITGGVLAATVHW
ncbi:hypothetical protein [Actinoplanes palleronii]|uniref:Uncharacterized protein n=1 Tax=Actinoplanes palleronii TaxID=113570 RepID=A0ABQ4BFR1_9ACTN|nr:hypothetical protein [Actinoplanes palleronii]GIE69514.1 hypothetical protein Apa02nite_056220 [Actinoplanes palleronii]